MLPPFIIEQIRKREEDTRHNNQRPHLELPLPAPPPPPRRSIPEDDSDRGIVILEIG